MVSANEIQGDGDSSEEVMIVWTFSDIYNQVKINIKNFKGVFQVEDDGGIGGKCICVQPIAINKEILKC